MVEPSEIAYIEIDNTIYLNEKILLIDHNDLVREVITPKPGKAEVVFKQVVSNWLKALEEIENEKNSNIDSIGSNTN